MDNVAGFTTAGVGAGGHDAGVPHAAHAAPDEGAPVLGNRCVPAAARGAGTSLRCMDREIRGSNPNSVRFIFLVVLPFYAMSMHLCMTRGIWASQWAH